MVRPRRNGPAQKIAGSVDPELKRLAAELEKAHRRLARESAERKRLDQQLRSLPHQILLAQDRERRRIAAELHDGVNQLLGSIKFRLMHAEGKLDGDPNAAFVKQARELIERAVTEVRRISHNLRPGELDDFGLIPAIEGFLNEFETRTKIQVEFKRGALPKRLPERVELAVYRILQEALTNVEQHARAKHVTISLWLDGNFAMLNVRDDGRGFTPAKGHGPDVRGHGLGVISMRERAQANGGVFVLKSEPGTGVEITVHVKLQD